MSEWPKYNRERHAYFSSTGKKRVPYCPLTRGGCGQPCSLESPCRCCETARADEAEAAVAALTARLVEAVPASYVAMKERALLAEARADEAERALDRVRELTETDSWMATSAYGRVAEVVAMDELLYALDGPQ